ncbi:MAG: (deoxy)nucleoside triphosphate pyrophosphohydrolase [Luteibaculum sp.]
MIEVVCAIIIKKDKIFACCRGPQQENAGLWEFPGGKVEKGESHFEALIREMKEELNLHVVPSARFDPKCITEESRGIRLLPIVCEIVGGQLTLREHDKYEWIPLSSLDKYKWTRADLKLLPHLELLDPVKTRFL